MTNKQLFYRLQKNLFLRLDWCILNYEETLQEIIDRGTTGASAEWLDVIKEEYGAVPLIYKKMAKKPEVLLSHLLFKEAIAKTSSLEPKMVELISLAVGAALNCRHCVEYHMNGALKKGATKEEILEVVLIAGSLAQAAVLADAYRVIDAGNGNGNGNEAPCEDSCDLQGVSLKKSE